MCVCYVCVLLARVYLFIYLFLADRRNRKRKAEGREQRRAASPSFPLCMSVCECGCKEGGAELVAMQAGRGAVQGPGLV